MALRYIFLIFFILSCLLLPTATQAADQTSTLSLAECVKTVLARNPGVYQAKSGLAEQEEKLSGTRKDLLPTLGVQYSYLHQPEAFYGTPHDQFSYGLVVEQPIYHGKSLVTTVKQQELALGSARSSLEQTINDTVYTVYDAYFMILRNIKIEDEVRLSVSRLTSHYNDARAFFEAGLIPKNDLLQSEVELAQGEQNLLRAQNQSSLSRAKLNILLGNPVEYNLPLVDILKYEITKINWDVILEQARQHRPELIKAELAVNQAENNIILSRAPFLPAVDFSASYMKIGDEPGAGRYPGGPSEFKQAQITATWKLWTWGKDRNEVLAARQRLFTAKKEAERILDEITIEVRQAFLFIEEAEQKIKVTEKAVAAARENYRINQDRYQSQVSTSTDVLDAETLLSEAMKNYYNALYGYNLAQAAVKRASGVLGREYLPEKN